MVENSEMVRGECGEPINGSELTKLMTVRQLLIKISRNDLQRQWRAEA